MNITEKRQIIKPGETIIERGQSSFFYCNKASAPFKLRLSDGSSLIMSSRRRIKLNEPLDIFCLENDTDQPIEVSYTMGFGDFTDDSLFIEGTIDVSSSSEKPLITADVTYSQVKTHEFSIADGMAMIKPSGTAKKMIIQNLGVNKMSVFGLQLLPLGTLELNFKEPFNIIGTDGDKLILTEFE